MKATDYHAFPALNYSGIKQLLKSPAHYQAYMNAQKEPSPAMKMGSAIHAAVLEPHVFDSEYAVMPDGIDRRTKAGKEAYAALEASGKTILSGNDYQQVLAVANAVRNNVTAAKLLKKGKAEVSIVTEIDGLPAKCRMDWITGSVIVDLKTTDDASPEGFRRSVAKYSYHVQNAWYIDCAKAYGMDIAAFIFIAIEKEPPYAVGIYELLESDIEVGRSCCYRAMDIYRHCTKTGEWPGYSTDIVTLQLPEWATREAA